MLALVPVVLVYGAVLVAPALVGQVPAHGPLEEALAAFTRDLPVMLPTGLIATNNARKISLAKFTVFQIC